MTPHSRVKKFQVSGFNSVIHTSFNLMANFCKRDRRGERGGGGKEKEKEKGKKERKRKEEKKKRRRKEGGGPFSNPLSLLNMCVKSCASFSVTTRCRCYCFPRGTSLLHFLLPAFALLLLPATAASPAPTSSPTRTSIASFTTTFRLLLPPTSAILCFRFLLVSRFRFLFTGSFPTSDIHVAYQSPVSSLVGLPRRCSSNGSGNDDCHPPPIECISSAICHSGPASGLHAFHVSRM